MDYAACNLVYVDRTAGEDRLIKRGDAPLRSYSFKVETNGQRANSSEGVSVHVNGNIEVLLEIFSEGTFAQPHHPYNWPFRQC